MRSRRVEISDLQTYDFSDLGVEGTQTITLRRRIRAAGFKRGTLMVRVHGATVGSGSDGHITVNVRADGFTKDDPAQTFYGETLGSIVAASDGSSAPAYDVEAFAVPSSMVLVQITARQDSSAPLSLTARVSVDLLLDDGHVEDWTPISLSPEGWWRGDLGHSAADGGTVNPWTNQGSDSTLTVSQATATSRPIFDEVNANFNNRSSIHYNGAKIHSSGNTPGWEIPDGSNVFTFVAVARVDTSARHELMSTSGGHGEMLLRIRVAGTSVDRFEDTSGAALTSTTSTRAINTTYVKSTVFTGATSPSNDSLESFFDGISSASASGDLGNIRPNGGSGTKPINFGGTTTTVATLTGDIAELLILKRALTSGEEASYVNYLNSYYARALTALV